MSDLPEVTKWMQGAAYSPNFDAPLNIETPLVCLDQLADEKLGIAQDESDLREENG
jgi:hypothetical protein